jgi:hypothetical protein
MKTTVKIVNVNNQNNRMSFSERHNVRWTHKDDNVLLRCLKDAVKESRTLVTALEECAMLTGRTEKSVRVRYYQYVKPTLKESFYFSKIRKPKSSKQNFVKVEKQTTSTTLDLHYATTKELFNKLSLEKKLRLISECIACNL